jgi:hypothetical protein
MIRGFPNGETYPEKIRILQAIGERTWGSETSQYPEEKRTIVIPLVAASEKGTA